MKNHKTRGKNNLQLFLDVVRRNNKRKQPSYLRVAEFFEHAIEFPAARTAKTTAYE